MVDLPITDIEIDEIVSIYRDFEREYPVKVVNASQFNTPVNFKQAKLVPRHRWYTYKEGFSPLFVEDFIRRFSKSPEDVIFDPFGGIGTTVLQSSLLNFRAFSNDINSLSNYVALVKTDNYCKNDVILLKEPSTELAQTELTQKSPPPDNATGTTYLTDQKLDAVLRRQY